MWGPECQGTAAEHPERLVLLQLRGTQMTQSLSHLPPPNHHTAATKHQASNEMSKHDTLLHPIHITSRNFKKIF